MPALETVQVTHHLAKAPRQVRISPKVRRAVELMVLEGKRRAEAAEAVQMLDESLRQALIKPAVRAYRDTQLQVIRENAASRTIAKAEQLMDSADSEHVQADMTKWIAGLEGISPVAKSESTINHKGLGPGLVIQIAAPVPPIEQAQLIRNQPTEAEYVSREKHLQLPVPHPARGTPEISGEFGVVAAEPEGKNREVGHDLGTPPARLTKKSSGKKSARGKRRGLFADPKALDAVLREKRGK